MQTALVQPPAQESTTDSVSRTRAELEQFKTRFASATPSQARSFLTEAEDLLIHVVGQSRYDSLKEAADEITTRQEEVSAERRRTGQTYSFFGKHQREDKPITDALDRLKQRVAGIEYRK